MGAPEWSEKEYQKALRLLIYVLAFVVLSFSALYLSWHFAFHIGGYILTFSYWSAVLFCLPVGVCLSAAAIIPVQRFNQAWRQRVAECPKPDICCECPFKLIAPWIAKVAIPWLLTVVIAVLIVYPPGYIYQWVQTYCQVPQTNKVVNLPEAGIAYPIFEIVEEILSFVFVFISYGLGVYLGRFVYDAEKKRTQSTSSSVS